MSQDKIKMPENVRERLNRKGVIRQGMAEVRLKNAQKTGNITVREYYNTETGEEEDLLSKSGNYRSVVINKNKKFDLSKIEECLEFYHIKNHPVYSNGPDAIFDCIELDKEAQTKVDKRELSAEAYGIIRKLQGEDLKDFGRIVLLDRRIDFSSRTSDTVLKSYLYDLADENPELIITSYKDEDKELKILIRKGLETQFFTNHEGIYKMGAKIIGNNFDRAVEYLKDNEDLLPNIRKEIG